MKQKVVYLIHMASQCIQIRWTGHEVQNQTECSYMHYLQMLVVLFCNQTSKVTCNQVVGGCMVYMIDVLWECSIERSLDRMENSSICNNFYENQYLKMELSMTTILHAQVDTQYLYPLFQFKTSELKSIWK